MKRILCCLIAVVVVSLSSWFPVGATMTGDTQGTCTLTFVIIDETNGYDQKITVQMNDITGTVSESYLLTEANSWGGGSPKYTVPAPTTYKVTFEGLADGYQMVDTATREPVEKFSAGKGEKTLAWSIIKEGGSTIIPGENETVTADNEEAEKVFNDFLEAVKFIETDSTWGDGFGTFLGNYIFYSNGVGIYNEWFVKYVNGGTVEQFDEMNMFDRFVWIETYVRPAAMVDTGKWDKYFSSWEAYETNLLEISTLCMNGNNSEVVKEAFTTLMKWQYDYIIAHGAPFNFITNRSYYEEIGGITGSEEESTHGEEIFTDDKGESMNAQDETAQSSEGEENDGIWGPVLNKLKNNIVSIIIMIILAGALGVVVYIRKKNNIGESDQQ